MHIAENTHWYTLEGHPMYEVPAAKGGMRPTTLRDARKMNLCPSVTTIIKCAAAPGLERWKSEQLLMAALTLPRRPDEPEAAWLDRVRSDSRQQGKDAADAGTALHASVQGHFEGTPPDPDHWPHVQGVRDALFDRFVTVDEWNCERSFSHPLGFGGKCDIYGKGAVIDFKTKEFDKTNLPGIWDEHGMQLAAYRMGLGMPHARCAIVYISRTVPGLAHVCELDQPELDKGWNCFKALLDYWQARSGYRPNFEKAAA